LGRQPIANKFLREDEFKDEFFYNLKVVFDDDTKLVSLKDFGFEEKMSIGEHYDGDKIIQKDIVFVNNNL
jgi:hypothetical protein